MRGDINDTLLAKGPDAVLERHDNAPLYLGRESANGRAKHGPLIVSTAKFIGDFVPPDYLIDGLLQRRFLYSLTAPTGAGKTSILLRICAHVDQGLPLAGREIDRGKVLFLAGENPDDVRMRWIKQLEEMDIDSGKCAVLFRAGSLKLSDKELRRLLDQEIKANGPFSLIGVDTSAAFFSGDEENNNVQLGNHARTLRSFVSVPGGPTVLVTCHPPKNADQDSLLPRGGGAFIAEVDGNLVCYKRPDSQIVELHWQGKFRGPDFAPIPFRIAAGTTPKLVDSKGRSIFTVTARPVSEAEVIESEAAARNREDQLLAVLEANPRTSLSDLARKLSWFYSTGEPNKSLVDRTLKALKADGRSKKEDGKWVATTRQGKVRKRETAEGMN